MMQTQHHKMARVLLAITALGCVMLAATVSFTDDSISLRTNFFSDSGGLLVQSPTFQFVKEMTQNTILSLQYTLDRVNIPPYRGISAKPLIDGIAGASKPATTDPTATYIKNRNEILATLNGGRWNGTVYYSLENDYTGRLLGVGFNQDLNQKNTNFSIGMSYGYDTIKPVGNQKVDSRKNLLATAAITQTVSPTAILRFGLDVSHIAGYQVNPYRQVFVGGQYFPERHPRQRTRAAGYVKLNKHLNPANASLWTEYRLYGDDWGIISHTLGLQFYQNLSPRLLIRYRYRFYTQNSAYFWRRNYTGQPRYFTDDYKLEPFNSHLYGFQVTYKLEGLRQRLALFEHSMLDVKYERFFTSNNFTANVFQFGLTFEY